MGNSELMLPPSGEHRLLYCTMSGFLPSIYFETSLQLPWYVRNVCFHYRLLRLGLEGKVIRSQDLSGLIMMVARNPQGHYLAWNFVKKNWDTLVQKLVQHKRDYAESLLLLVHMFNLMLL